MIPILKAGKVADKMESYRPIQLTSCFSKLMERIVARRLAWFVENEGLLSKYQCAFRKNRCTVDHVVRLESEVRSGFLRNKYTLAVFLDFQSAYNLTNTTALLWKLYHLGFRGRLMCYLREYLKERTFQVKCGRLSDNFNQTNGLLQGGVISPLLFNLMINDIFDNIPDYISYAIYADDCTMWIQGRNLTDLVQTMQTALHDVTEWCRKWGFVFTPSKCTAVVFRRFMRANEMQNIPPLTLLSLGEQLFGLKSTLILIKVTNVDIVYNCINDNPKSAYE